MVFFASLFFFFLGSILGSFSTAIIYRTKKNQSWILADNKAARSSCPQCKAKLNIIDLLPLISWLYLRGQCRHCKGSISPNYLYIELACSFIAMGLYLYWGLKVELFLSLLLLPFLLSQVILMIGSHKFSVLLLAVISAILIIWTFFFT